ncbi:hypothetical protein [Patiriisocius marinus]|uniref:Lipoprotein n=1 Tax=Patiriisocius marinus TaxID=1397112 RepID=A0A5J4IWV7_9FLAO|nr:hypothetical protein [Patiriisocius marinus]GER58320.1 hypothetical protein ULMA_04280 [Patiriisocius marinus]
MIRFLLSSLLILTLFSCGPKIIKGLEVPVSKQNIGSPYFSDLSKDYVYKAKLDIYGNYFGGILIVKKISEVKHRVVFTTEFGSKIFDFLYDGDTFTKNFILPDLDRKIVVNTLEKDFRILITEKTDVVSQYQNSEYDVFETANSDGGNLFSENVESKQLYSIANAPNGRIKILITFNDVEENIAKKININHNNIKLSIALEYLKK